MAGAGADAWAWLWGSSPLLAHGVMWATDAARLLLPPLVHSPDLASDHHWYVTSRSHANLRVACDFFCSPPLSLSLLADIPLTMSPPAHAFNTCAALRPYLRREYWLLNFVLSLAGTCPPSRIDRGR